MKTCSFCIMDESDPQITFNKKGICNHCENASKEFEKYSFSANQVELNLKNLSLKIKKEKKIFP